MAPVTTTTFPSLDPAPDAMLHEIWLRAEYPCFCLEARSRRLDALFEIQIDAMDLLATLGCNL